jgi:hypothetical protein
MYSNLTLKWTYTFKKVYSRFVLLGILGAFKK